MNLRSMIKEIGKSYSDGVKIIMFTPYDQESKHTELHIRLFSRYIHINLPKLFSPEMKWVDNPPDMQAECGIAGFWAPIRKVYGFSIDYFQATLFWGPQPSEIMEENDRSRDCYGSFIFPWVKILIRHDILTIKQDNPIPIMEYYGASSKDSEKFDSVPLPERVAFFEYFDKTNNKLVRAKAIIEEKEWARSGTRIIQKLIGWIEGKIIRRSLQVEFEEDIGPNGHRFGNIELQPEESMQSAISRFKLTWIPIWDGPNFIKFFDEVTQNDKEN